LWKNPASGRWAVKEQGISRPSTGRIGDRRAGIGRKQVDNAARVNTCGGENSAIHGVVFAFP
jgi:hypothetical protein